MPFAPSPTVSLRLPRTLLQYWNGPPSVELDAPTLAEALAQLEQLAPGLTSRLLDDQGRIRRHVAVFVNSEMVDGGDPARVLLEPGDRVQIVPSVSGG